MRYALILVCILSTFGQEKAPPSPEELTRTVESLAKTSSELRSLIPREELDPAALANKLDNDPVRLIDYVRNRIGFEEYRGFMKGARGALVSRRANSADKALLLATLLAHAGERVEIVQGTVDPKTLPDEAPFPDLGGTTPDDAAIRTLSARVDKDPAELQARLEKQQSRTKHFRQGLWTRLMRDLDTVSRVLSATPIPDSSQPAPSSEHWWVRRKSGDVDPTLGKATGQAAAVHAMDKLPPDAFHRVTVQMKIRRDDQEVSLLKVAMNSSDAFGESYRIAIVPVDGFEKVWNPKKPYDSKVFELLSGTTRFQPVFVSAKKTIAGHPFDLQGNRIPVKDGVIEKMKGAAEFFGDLAEENKKKTQLKAAWLDIRVDAPGQESVAIRRTVLADGVTGRQRVLDLCSSRDLLVLPGELSPLFVTDLMLAFAAGSKPDKPGTLRDRPPLHPALYVFALERQAALRGLAPRGTMPRPTLLSYTRRFVDAKPVRIQSTFDILDNPILGNASLKWTGNLAFAAGMLDTALEHEGHRTPGRHLNASVLMEKAKPVVVRDLVPDDLAVSAAARREISAHLPGAVCVVIPSTPAAWYRIDLATGSTLGYVEGGGGQDSLEYVTLVSDCLKTISEWNSYFELIRDILECVVSIMTAEGDPGRVAAECALRIYSGQFIGTLVSAFFVPVPELPFLWAVQDHITDEIDNWAWGD